MFRRAGHKATNTLNASDVSHGLKSGSAWKQADLCEFGIVGEIACLAYDPVSSLLCVGTNAGQLYLFGRPVCNLLALSYHLSKCSTRASKFHGAPDRHILSSYLLFDQTLPF